MAERIEINDPPFDFEAECAAIGCVLIDNSLGATFLSILEECGLSLDKIFICGPTKAIIGSVVYMISERIPIDPVSLAGRLREDGSLKKAGGYDFLCQIDSYVFSTGNLEAYLDRVIRCARQRALMTSLRGPLTNGSHPGNLPETIESIQSQLMDISPPPTDGSLCPVGQNPKITEIHRALLSPDAERPIPTPWERYNRLVGGFRPSRMVGWAGMSHSGKTSLLFNAALSAAYWLRNRENEDGVAILFSLEEGLRSTLFAWGSMITGVNTKRWTLPHAQPRLAPLFATLQRQVFNTLPILVIEKPGCSFYDIVSTIERVARERPVRWVGLDFLQRMALPELRKAQTSEEGHRWNAEKIADLAHTSQRYGGFPLVAAIQEDTGQGLSGRERQQRRLSSMSNPRHAKAIFEACDEYAFLHNPALQDVETYSSKMVVRCQLYIKKARWASTGQVPLDHHRTCALFSDPSGIDEDPNIWHNFNHYGHDVCEFVTERPGGDLERETIAQRGDVADGTEENTFWWV